MDTKPISTASVEKLMEEALGQGDVVVETRTADPTSSYIQRVIIGNSAVTVLRTEGNEGENPIHTEITGLEPAGKKIKVGEDLRVRDSDGGGMMSLGKITRRISTR